jgi:hypothetical protein
LDKYGIIFHTRSIPYPIVHRGLYGLWNMDRMPGDSHYIDPYPRGVPMI